MSLLNLAVNHSASVFTYADVECDEYYDSFLHRIQTFKNEYDNALTAHLARLTAFEGLEKWREAAAAKHG